MGNILVAGSLNMDIVINTEHIPRPGETVFGKSFAFNPGGKGANQAYTAGKLGARVSMIGAVGKDDHGKIMVESLQSVGVDTAGIRSFSYTPSGMAFIAVDREGENSIVVVPGANSELTIEDIDRNLELIDRCDVVIAQLEIPIEVVTYLAEAARSRKKLVILDPAPAPSRLPEKLIRNVDIMKPNETELQRITGMMTDTPEQIAEAARSLIEKGAGKIAVTLGAKGTILVTEHGYEVFPARMVEAVDTTAAGDAFLAALAVKTAEGSSLEDAIRFAGIVASIVVTRKGAQCAIPDYQEVYKIYKEYIMN